MNRVENSASIIAEYINRNVENASSVAVLKMSLITIINFLIVTCTVLFICLFTGKLLAGLIAVFCSPFLRYFSGGIHMKSANVCNVISAILILIAVHVPISYMYTGIGLTVITMLILLLYAPQGILNHSKLEAKYYPILKLISLCIVASNFYFQSPLLSAVFFAQAITIIPLAQKLVDYYENRDKGGLSS